MENLSVTLLSNDNTVDREVETKFVLDVIKNQVADAIIIYSESGVGKSTLANRIMKQTEHLIPLCIRTTPENQSLNVTEGVYLGKIFNCIVNFFQKYKNIYPKGSFEYYLTHNKNAYVKREALESMFESLAFDDIGNSAGTSITKYVAARVFKLYEYNPSSRLILSSKDSMLIAHEYIKYILNMYNVCINIDNLQNIDDYTRQLLVEWISISQRTNFFLLEYTLSITNTTDKLLKFAGCFKDLDLDIQLLPLNALDSVNALKALQNTQPCIRDNRRFFDDAKKFYMHHTNGNMQKLIDYSLHYSFNSILKESYDPTLERLNMLDNQAKYLLAIIIMHGGEIEEPLIQHFAVTSLNPIVINYQDIIKKLDNQQELIKNENSNISIMHASITDTWNNHPEIFDKYNLLAFRHCSEYYKKITQDKKNYIFKERIDQALLFLLKVYSLYAPEKIQSIISNINEMVSERIRPENVWEYYLIFLDYIEGEEEKHISLLYNMMLFCFNHFLFKNCLYLIQKIEDIASEQDEEKLFVYKVNCIELLGMHTEAIELCENRLMLELPTEKLYNSYLILIGCYRSINDKNKVMEYVEKIKAISDYDTFNAYGIYLRLSETYMERQKALSYVKQSVDFFVAKQNSILEAKSRLTYSFLLAVTTDIKEAEIQLNKCEKLVAKNHFWESAINLNKASILLLQKKYGSNISTLLKKAELSANCPFDLLLILTLQLINEYEISPDYRNDYLIKRITLLLLHERDKHLIALVSYDLYLYFTKIRELEKASGYYEMAQSVKNYNETVDCHLNNKVNENLPNLFNTKWCIGFTFFWNVDCD